MTQLIFFDLDGTIFKTTNIYRDIARFLGPDAAEQDQELMHAYFNGEISYIEWVHRAAVMYKAAGLKKSDFYRFVDSAEYYHGVKELFSTLHNADFVTGIVSGSFDALAKRAQRELKINHRFASLELFWDGEYLDHWNISPTGFEAKVDFMRIIAREYNIPLSDCVFVGDGFNDVHIAQAVGTSIGFNPNPALEKVATYSIHQPSGKEDLSAILQYLSL